MLTAPLLLLGGLPGALRAQEASFEHTVQPMLRKHCTLCHNGNMASGDLNIDGIANPSSIETDREAWERIVSKVRSGEMPPKGVPRPQKEQVDAFVEYLWDTFDRIDRSRPPDPGRVVARRLNRVEYANTIRDLLGVHFRVDQEFPPDDSVLGFDNIGDVLTVSPLLVEKYIYAAEKIASRAVGGDPLPKPFLIEIKPDRVLRLDIGASEVTEHVDYNGEYTFRAWIRGHLGPEGKPVTLRMFVDGKQVYSAEVDTRENETSSVARDAQRTNEEVRVYLTAGPHTFRAEIVGEDFRKPVPPPPVFRPGFGRPPEKLMFWPEKFDLFGPFPSDGPYPTRERILTCNPATGAQCIEQIMRPLARRAYRRPVGQAEVAKLVGVTKAALDQGFKPDQALQYAIQAMLVSPQFLFRIERDPEGDYGPISDIELASRLSYFLWSSMPDDELLDLAEAGKLRDSGLLDQQVKRMLADPRSEALAENFGGQWLETRGLAGVKPDPDKFRFFNDGLRRDMATETRLFVDALLRENRPISELLTADYSFLNDRLARHYGIEGVTGPEFRRVQLDGKQRGGVLGHASVLTVTSYPARTSPVLRGKYILEVILGSPPPPAPPNVPALNEDDVGSAKSLREEMEKHRADPVCNSCHSRMDPLGFGLENYDAVGRWRAEDGGAPVQAGGTLPDGTDFSTPAELRDLLYQELPEFTRNVTEKMLTYALGRGLEHYDRAEVRDIVAKVEESGHQFQTLVREIIHSLPFQNRRGRPTDSKEVASR